MCVGSLSVCISDQYAESLLFWANPSDVAEVGCVHLCMKERRPSAEHVSTNMD